MLLAFSIKAQAVTYYVDSAAGRDSNLGISPNAPWQTVGKVMSELSSLLPGDAVLFRGGGVWTQEFDINVAVGSPSNPIVFSSYSVGRPVLDELGKNHYCIDAIGTTARYLKFDNFECRHATEQGVTFQTSGGGMPGITVQNFYIHNTGPGAFNSSSAIVGTDDGNYANQLDFEDFGQGADNVHFINNVVKWAGGHNCLEVHYDTGAVIVQGNAVGPGCVHGAIDVKGVGNPTTPATIRANMATCGFSAHLCGCQTSSCNPTPAFYTENTYAASEEVIYSLNVAYDSGVGFQDCPGGCSNGTGCAMNVKYYNNDAYISSSVPNSFGIYANGTCDGAAASSAAIDLRNNVFDGSVVSVNGMSSVTENYNDIGGAQGNAGFSLNGSTKAGLNDKNNVDPPYVNAASIPPNYHLQLGSKLIKAGQTGLTTLTDIGAY